MRLHIVLFARNEAARIGGAIDSLPPADAGTTIHVLVNGSTDGTARIAAERTRGRGDVRVHDLPFGGKARTWNHYVDALFDDAVDAVVFMDGDVTLAPAAIPALVAALDADPGAGAVAAAPSTGRNAARYRAGLQAEHGLFGGLYLVRGAFLARLRASGIRLPIDLVGDDGLIGALVKTDLGGERHWRDERIAFAPDASFACERIALTRPSSLRLQYRRMLSYSLRRYQNLVISGIMRGPGPAALPIRLADLYAANRGLFTLRMRPGTIWFDWLARRRMLRGRRRDA